MYGGYVVTRVLPPETVVPTDSATPGPARTGGYVVTLHVVGKSPRDIGAGVAGGPPKDGIGSDKLEPKGPGGPIKGVGGGGGIPGSIEYDPWEVCMPTGPGGLPAPGVIGGCGMPKGIPGLGIGSRGEPGSIPEVIRIACPVRAAAAASCCTSEANGCGGSCCIGPNIILGTLWVRL